MHTRYRAICSISIFAVMILGLLSTIESTAHPNYNSALPPHCDSTILQTTPDAKSQPPANAQEEPDLVMLLVGLGVCGSGLLSLKSKFSSY